MGILLAMLAILATLARLLSAHWSKSDHLER
jgi:hypothetical protein